MNKRSRILIVASFIVLLISSCGTTSILTNNPNVDLYVNNIYKGKGQTTVRRTGFPQKIYIEAKYEGKTVGEFTQRRKFDIVTFLGCYFTGVGMLFTFQYPDVIIVPVSINPPSAISKWRKESIWKKPPGMWKR